MQVRIAETDEELLACHPVMHELRPHIEREGFPALVRSMEETEHYRIAYGEVDGRVVAVAGFRLCRHMAWGRTLYVDDLVTAEDARSRGHGKAMLEWLKAEAARLGCDALHLDSGTWRGDAHRFYEREGLEKWAYHFRVQLRQ